MSKNIPIYAPDLSGREKEYVNDCIGSTWISSKGKYIGAFEKSFSDYIGAEHSTSVSNGTVALHLALLSLGIGAGDEVIVPTLTYVASVNAIKYVGATPVLVDSKESTWVIDPDRVKEKITDKTKAILAVHIYGCPFDFISLRNICDSEGLFLIENSAEAFGSKYGERYAGNLGDVSIFSFYGNKTITTGEGGMLATNSEEVYRRAVHYKQQGVREDGAYYHDIVGYNYRMTNICAAIGLAQLERADKFLARKREIAKLYINLLAKYSLEYQVEPANCTHSYWMFTILFRSATEMIAARDCLNMSGVETRPIFTPAHMLPMYRDDESSYPIATDVSMRGFNVPSWPGLKDEDVERIVHSIGVGLE